MFRQQVLFDDHFFYLGFDGESFGFRLLMDHFQESCKVVADEFRSKFVDVEIFVYRCPNSFHVCKKMLFSSLRCVAEVGNVCKKFFRFLLKYWVVHYLRILF